MSDTLQHEMYIRTPFQVKVIQITEKNIEEVAKMIGEVKVKDDEKYIAVDKRIVPSITRAFVGWYVTVFGDNLRCYSPHIFAEQFTKLPDDKQIMFQFSEDDEAPAKIITGIDEAVELPQPTEEDGTGNDHPQDVIQSQVLESTDVAEDPMTATSTDADTAMKTFIN